MNDEFFEDDLHWRHLHAEELEREYSPSSCLPDGDYRPFVKTYQTRSTDAWAVLDAHPDITTFELDDAETAASVVGAVPPSTTPAPLLVFIHGGYWQELSVDDSLFAARDCIDRGWAFAAVEYTLAPDANLDQIVGECRWAVTALINAAPGLGIDPDRIVVSGSSAGAHLAAMVAFDPVSPTSGPAAGRSALAGVVLVSGVFELEPLLGTSINDAVGIDTDAANRNSPLRLDVRGFPPAIVAVGSDETSQFKAQSSAFSHKLRAAGVPVTHLEIVGRNHFDVILEVATPGCRLGDAVAELIDQDER